MFLFMKNVEKYDIFLLVCGNVIYLRIVNDSL